MRANETTCIAPALHSRVLKLMRNRFEISIITDDSRWADECIGDAVEEIRRIEQLFTTFNDSSQTNLINRHAGIAPVVVDREVFNLIQRSRRISDLTQGAFDISYDSID